jgi:hypothetical protein
MSIKVSTEVWLGSRNKSGNLLVLLALADHADDQGIAWPGVPLLARKARLSERHTRRCLNQLVASGELKILPNQARSGRALYKIRLDQLAPAISSSRTSASGPVSSASMSTDADDRSSDPPYIEEPSIESPEESSSTIQIDISNPQNPSGENNYPTPNAIGLVSSPKSGF